MRRACALLVALATALLMLAAPALARSSAHKVRNTGFHAPTW
jgi:hypothetical protein